MTDSSPSSSPAQREWVLVVDDDAPLRRMVADTFSSAGVEVVGAAGGAEALAILDSRPDEPVLLLIDVLMPGIDGLTLARKIRSKFKRGTIVIMSGHLTDLSWWPVELREVAFLSKPFHIAELNGHLATARATFQREG